MSEVLSFIVCTYNGSDRLTKVLESIYSSVCSYTALDYEVIVVDNGSDVVHGLQYKEIIESFSVKINIIYCMESRVGLTHARRHGVQKASGSIVAFIDDDNYIFGDWISSIREVFADDKIGLVGGKVIAPSYASNYKFFNPIKQALAIWEPLQTSCLDLDIDFGHPPGAGMIVRKDLMKLVYNDSDFFNFGRVGGNTASGDDSFIALKIRSFKKKTAYLSTIGLIHDFGEHRLDKIYLQNLFKSMGQSGWPLHEKFYETGELCRWRYFFDKLLKGVLYRLFYLFSLCERYEKKLISIQYLSSAFSVFRK